MSLPTLSPDNVMIGNASGWGLTFHTETSGQIQPPVLSVSSHDYEARLHASLPAGLEGGEYSITIEGLIDAHYALIAQNRTASPTVVRLYLFWVDANADAAGYLANLAGLTDTLTNFNPTAMAASLIAELKITKVSRDVGERHYEATIEGRERAYELLASSRLATSVAAAHVRDAAATIGQRTNVTIQPEGFNNNDGSMPTTGNGTGNEQVSIDAGGTYLAALNDLAQRMEHSTGKYGRGMLLIRNGTIHFGVRSIPLEGQSKNLMLSNGLLQSEALDPVSADPDASTDSQTPPPTRRQFKLILKGRPDLKPGDLARFDCPPAEALLTQPNVGNSLIGAFAGSILPVMGSPAMDNPVNLYVTSVKHVLGRSSGFSTTITGVELTDLSHAWDTASGTSSHAPGRATGTSGNRVDSATNAAGAIRQLVREGSESQRGMEMAEVRSFYSSSDPGSEPPTQTEMLWRGLVEADGRANQARRLEVLHDTPNAIDGVAYASPFAWGKAGLILPRYPGMRVAVVHRNGRAEDPVDLGAVWKSGEAPKSMPGDFWLILPSRTDSSQRAQVPDTARPDEYSGPATNDLIDADGNRMIEVGELTIRVGRSQLKDAGERPERPDDDESITIQHVSGSSSIIMKQDGSITITGKNITLDAGTGSITMKADSVDVQVSSNMNVH